MFRPADFRMELFNMDGCIRMCFLPIHSSFLGEGFGGALVLCLTETMSSIIGAWVIFTPKLCQTKEKSLSLKECSFRLAVSLRSGLIILFFLLCIFFLKVTSGQTSASWRVVLKTRPLKLTFCFCNLTTLRITTKLSSIRFLLFVI